MAPGSYLHNVSCSSQYPREFEFPQNNSTSSEGIALHVQCPPVGNSLVASEGIRAALCAARGGHRLVPELETLVFADMRMLLGKQKTISARKGEKRRGHGAIYDFIPYPLAAAELFLWSLGNRVERGK